MRPNSRCERAGAARGRFVHSSDSDHRTCSNNDCGALLGMLQFGINRRMENNKEGRTL